MMSSIGKILVVDDEVELKNVLVEALTSQGYEAAGFTDGTEALGALRTQAFDVLLTDLMMPGIDGITLVREALQIDPHLVCMVMTGQGTIQTAVDAMKEGAFDYVLKPFRLQTVLPVLTRAMNTRHMRLENLQLRETVAIYELGQTIAFTLDPQTVVSKLADAALQQTDADEVSILLPTGGGDELYVAAVRGENRERLLGERVPLDETISGWVAREREALILNGEVNDKRFRSLWPHPEICSAISIPMQVAGKLVGIININALSRPRPFTLGQMKALTILAGTAAAALESASLYGQVQQAKENYRAIFENAVEGIFQSTAEGRFITANPAMARILGYNSPEELTTDVTDITKQIYVHPEDRTESARREQAQGFLRGFEFEAFRKDGERIWLSLNRHSVHDENGRELYREGSVEEITQRKRAEEVLRETARSKAESLALLDTTLSSAPIGFAFHNCDLVFERINESLAAINGLPVEDHIGRTLREILPEMAPMLEPLLQQVLDTGEPVLDIELDGETPADPGHKHYWLVSLYPVRMQEGEILGVGVLVSEVTARKQAEQALRESEERYRDLVENAQDIIYSHDLKGNYTSSNKAGEEITGYTLEESLKLNLVETVAPEYVAKAREMLARKLAGENVTAYELELIAKDGHRVAVEVNTRLVLEDGVAVGVTGIARDITERKRAEAGLALFRRLVDQSNDGIYVVDAGTSALIDVNETACRQLGYARAELLRLRVIDINSDLTTETAWEMHRQTLQAARSMVLEFDGKRKDGSTFPLELSLRYVSLNDQQYVLAVTRDISERKVAEAELRRLAAAVEETAESIVITDKEGNIQYVNPAFERVTGYTKEEVLNQNPRILKSGKTDPAVYKDLWETITRREVWTGHLTNRRKDGSLFEERATISPIYDEAHEIVNFVAVKQDISDLIQLEEQLRQSQKMEAIGQLAGGVAHDFNNLLTAINGYSALALQRLEDGHPIRSYLEEVKKAGDRATNLTRQLLAFGRKQILQPLALDLNGVVSDMNKLLRRLIGEDIVLTAKLDSDVGKVMADPGQIEQVLVNLIVNARDAMPRGGNLTIETENVELDDEYGGKHVGVVPGKYVLLAVSDTGEGMSEEVRRRIFEPFFTTKEKGKGTGLGLSTVYGIVKQSGGNIWVYTEPGEGTTFKVYLPRVESKTHDPGETVIEAAPLGGSETILLVEDEDVVRSLARRILEQAGYSVVAASRGDEALRFCEEHAAEVDLLLTDVVMPEMSGKELADQLKLQSPELKMLFMSGYTDESIVHHGVLDSSVEFIQKPFTPAALIKKVREVLDSNGNAQ